MGIATPTSHQQQQLPHHISHHQPPPAMSHHHGFQHGFLGFPQSVDDDDGNTQGQPRPHNTMDHSTGAGAGDPTSVYDPSGASSILSDIFNFGAGTGAVPSATEFLASQIAGGWYAPTPAPAELFLMNPPPAPPPQHPRGYAGGPGQGLSLSLSSTLQQLEPTKPEDLFFTSSFPPDAGGQLGQSQPIHVAASLRQSKYARAAQDLLEEFCSVGRGQLKRARHSSNPNPNPNPASNAGGASSSTSKDPAAPPTLSASDRFEHQRKKTKLSSMLDEVDRRYNHYCDQMQMVVNSFDSVMGFGAAAPYTALARKAMSRHFRCLKDAVIAQLRKTCEALGEKDGVAVTGITRGETPRLRLLDQSLRQQRAFNQMGMMEQEAWRPQRGLPERSVNILRAWLFEHFLHPYPNDADKHMLARQTGLSRNQVTNWFINARVRLWKPMVEEMYQQEAREEDDDDDATGDGSNQGGPSQSPRQEQYVHAERSEINAAESEQPSSSSIGVRTQHHHQQQQYHHHHQHRFPPSSSGNHLHPSLGGGGVDFVSPDELPAEFLGMDSNLLANYNARMGGPGAQVRYGASGDVSLTLGLRHAGNMPENSHFSLRDFAGGGGGGL